MVNLVIIIIKKLKMKNIIILDSFLYIRLLILFFIYTIIFGVYLSKKY